MSNDSALPSHSVLLQKAMDEQGALPLSSVRACWQFMRVSVVSFAAKEKDILAVLGQPLAVVGYQVFGTGGPIPIPRSD